MPATATDRLGGLTTSVAVKAPCITVSPFDLPLMGLFTLNGVALFEGARVLVAAQTDPSENGIYEASAEDWERSADFDGVRDVVNGTLLTVLDTAGTGALYQVNCADQVPVVGESDITFTLLNPSANYPLPVAQGGTAANNPSSALTNLGLISMGAETSITGGLTMSGGNIGRSYLIADSGSPANFTIVLPASAPVGSMIQFRVSYQASKLYTISGNDVGIDGDPHRVLWRNETCLLIRENANWAKIGGRTIPFRGVLQRSASQSIASGTSFVACAMNQENGDPTNLALCLDAGNTRFTAPRHGNFHFTGNLAISASVSVSAATAGIALGYNTPSVTGAPASVFEVPYAVGQGVQSITTGGVYAMTDGDFLHLLGRIYGGTISTPTFAWTSGVYIPSLSYAEIPLW